MTPHQKAQALRAMIAQAEADEAAPHRPTLRERAMQVLKRRPELVGMLCILAPSQLECENYYTAPTAYRLKRRANNLSPVAGISLEVLTLMQYGTPLHMTQIPSLDATNGPKVMSPLTPETPPTTGKGDMWAQIIARLSPDDPLLPHCVERRQQGIDRYGVPLQTGNGRNVARDLFQEQMDSIAYAEQWISSTNNADEIEIARMIRWDSMNNARKLLEFIK